MQLKDEAYARLARIDGLAPWTLWEDVMDRSYHPHQTIALPPLDSCQLKFNPFKPATPNAPAETVEQLMERMKITEEPQKKKGNGGKKRKKSKTKGPHPKEADPEAEPKEESLGELALPRPWALFEVQPPAPPSRWESVTQLMRPIVPPRPQPPSSGPPPVPPIPSTHGRKSTSALKAQGQVRLYRLRRIPVWLGRCSTTPDVPRLWDLRKAG